MPDSVSFRGDAAHGSHPDLKARKRLAARVLLARNLGVRARGSSVKPGALKKLFLAASYHIDAEADDVRASLTEFLDHMMRAVDERRRKDQGAGDAATAGPVEALLRQLANEVATVSCEECQRRRQEDRRCEGKAADAYIVARGALCLDFVTKLFSFLVALAESQYSPLLPPRPADALTIRLKTRHTPEAKLAASTRFSGDGPSARSADVHIDLPIDFNATHLKRLPYLLFHEIFVHAPESWETQAPREATNERCALREGFVDAAALHVLQQGLRDPRLVPAEHHDLAEHYHREAGTAHKERLSNGPSGERFNAAGEDDGDLVATRESGALVFGRLKESSLAPEAVRLAICLNRLPLSENERIRAVMALRLMTDALYWSEPGGEPGTLRWVEAHRGVLAAAREGRADDLARILFEMVDPAEF